jgi:hypothetical protein
MGHRHCYCVSLISRLRQVLLTAPRCLYSLSAFFNILSGSDRARHSAYGGRGTHRTRQASRTRRSGWQSMKLLKPHVIFYSMLCGIFECVINVLPYSLQRRIHYARRYSNRLIYHASTSLPRIIRRVAFRQPMGSEFAFEELFCNCNGSGKSKCWVCARPVCSVNISLFSIYFN